MSIGYNAQAYMNREKGYSPEPERNAVWNIVGNQLKGKVIDAGSGEGGWVRKLKQNKNVENIISLDIVDDGASSINGVEFHICDLSSSSLPCESNEVDWIFAIEVIEHLANPRHFIQQSYRCLKNGGKLVLTTPNNTSLRARLSFLFRGYFPAFCEHDYKSTGHITPITAIDLKRMSLEAGFSQIDITYPLSGRIPKTTIEYKQIIPNFKGELWSDSLFAILMKKS